MRGDKRDTVVALARLAQSVSGACLVDHSKHCFRLIYLYIKKKEGRYVQDFKSISLAFETNKKQTDR